MSDCDHLLNMQQGDTVLTEKEISEQGRSSRSSSGGDSGSGYVDLCREHLARHARVQEENVTVRLQLERICYIPGPHASPA